DREAGPGRGECYAHEGADTARTRRTRQDKTTSLLVIRAVPVVSGFVRVFVSLALCPSRLPHNRWSAFVGLSTLRFPRIPEEHFSRCFVRCVPRCPRLHERSTLPVCPASIHATLPGNSRRTFFFVPR